MEGSAGGQVTQKAIERREEDRERGGFWRRLLTGYRAEPTPASRDLISPPSSTRTGICCSGGGVRSAAYNLGVLQELQTTGTLQQADYLAAVSGGSYIAAGMTLAARSAKTGPAPFAQGSPEEGYLRNRTTYLAPHGNEAIFFVYRMLLGLAMNLVCVGLVLGVPALLLGLALREHGFTGDDGHTSTPAWMGDAVKYAGIATLALGVFYVLRKFRKEKWRRTVQTWAVRGVIATVGLAFAFLLVPELVVFVIDMDGKPGSVGTGEGQTTVGVPAVTLATILAGLFAQLRAKPAKEVKDTATKAAKAVRTAGRRAQLALANFAGAVAVPLLALTWFVLVVRWAVTRGSDESVLIAVGAGVAAALVLQAIGDLTSWSLHPFYKSRLASAFALKRNDDGTACAAIDPYSIPRMSQSRPEGVKWPTLLVCAAANVSDPGATPHGRRVTSFTFDPDRLGGPLVGYVGTAAYERDAEYARTDVIHAVAVSGAAVSPSMGKLTKAPARALLALANIRLGVWLPNPRYCGKWTPKRPGPVFLLREMLGQNSVNSRYLYVSDGGHYENLALVELLRRGCTTIYCFDASSGASLAALGDAIALARSELGVEIDIDVSELEVKDGFAGSPCARGTIRYPNGTSGVLIYGRQLLTDDAPYDVLAHAQRDPRFPHDPILDQFFTDQRFEAYRELGAVAGRRALELAAA